MERRVGLSDDLERIGKIRLELSFKTSSGAAETYMAMVEDDGWGCA